METIKFTVGPYGSKTDIQVSDSQWHGDYIIAEISAETGRKAINELISENAEYQENPESLTTAIYKAALMSKAVVITKPGLNSNDPIVEPFTLPANGTEGIPYKLWSLLTIGYDRLNSVSDDEARFLLKLSSSTKTPSTQPSPLTSK